MTARPKPDQPKSDQPKSVQIFGTNKSRATKKALRFFKERGLKPHFADLAQRPIAPGELQRFEQKFGLNALIDTAGKAYDKQGLAYLRVPDEAMRHKLIDDPGLMVQPLVRMGKHLSLGLAEEEWKAWLQD